jgi:dephospho-CoA kinase
MAEQVFNNPEKLSVLNSLVHPVTIKDAEEWMQRQTTSYAIKEAALIFESGAQAQLDFVIGVYAPETIRLLRTLKRDGSSWEAVQLRIQQQMDDSIKMRLCDAIITNDDQQALIPQVEALHKQLLAKDGL